LKSADGTEVWHQQDNKFDKPKEIVTLYLYSNDCHESNSPKGDVFISLWKNVMENYQREFQYTSNMASLGFSFSNYLDQFVFTWYGYSQTVGNYVDQTLDQLNAMRNDENLE
jgi:secreted Zn-dependent insulinase-like peptidase